jgi:hypothetical protein
MVWFEPLQYFLKLLIRHDPTPTPLIIRHRHIPQPPLTATSLPNFMLSRLMAAELVTEETTFGYNFINEAT